MQRHTPLHHTTPHTTTPPHHHTTPRVQDWVFSSVQRRKRVKKTQWFERDGGILSLHEPLFPRNSGSFLSIENCVFRNDQCVSIDEKGKREGEVMGGAERGGLGEWRWFGGSHCVPVLFHPLYLVCTLNIVVFVVFVGRRYPPTGFEVFLLINTWRLGRSDL